MSIRQEIKELRQERGECIQKAGDILAREEEEERQLTDQEHQRWERLHDRADELKGEIEELGEDAEKRRRQEQAEESLAGTEGPASGRPDPEGRDLGGEQATAGDGEDEGPEYRDAFWKYIRHGMSDLEAEERQMVERRSARIDVDAAEAFLSEEARALTTGTGSSGGFTVPEDFADTLTEAEKQFGGMRRSRAEVIDTDNGRDLPWPSNDDTGNKGSLLSENTQVSETDVTFAETILGSFTYSSDLIRVPVQLLQDSAFDLEEWLPMKLGERIGRITNEHYTTGTGSSQPNGVVTASTKGADAANAGTVEYDDFVNLQHAVDPAYRDNGEWMLSDIGVREAKKIKDGQGNPIWQPGLADEARDTILGDPYVVNNDMANPGTGNKSVLYGDMSLYKIRAVQDVRTMVLRERYADFLQVGFLAFARRDGDLIDAGTNPVQHLLHP